MNFFQRRNYLKQYKSAIERIFAIYPTGTKAIFRQNPLLLEIFNETDISASRSPTELACISARIITKDALTTLSDEQRNDVFGDLRNIDFDLAASNVANAESGREYQLQSDITYAANMIAWASVVMDDLVLSEAAPEDTVRTYFNYVRGILTGMSHDEISQEILSISLHEAFGLPTVTMGKSDASRILAPLERFLVQPTLSGKSIKVAIHKSRAGISLERISDNETVWCPESIQTEFVNNADDHWSEGTLERLDALSGTYSCLVAGPNHDVFGDKEAFWWSFARSTVNTTTLSLTGVRFSEFALKLVKQTARESWESALQHSEGSIELMRDCPSYMKNIHLEALSPKNSSSEYDFYDRGTKVALAMVMATFSLEPKLEKWAFSLFSDIIWPTDDVPPEFRAYRDGK